MVSRHQDVGGVRIRESLDEVNQLTQRIVSSLEHLPLRTGLVTRSVDAVVVHVQHLVCAIEFAQLGIGHRENILRLNRESVHLCKRLVAVGSSVRALTVNHHRVPVLRMRQSLVGK